ncbi:MULTISPECIES: hypothetical protein [unclassified Rhodococcus (in: high G+C Gram-positive bacteria)]|uniref:hypothetical protein n=1 Tax=unclassified Rhodococcus (in: high G+C Gram-positive bacteria) TaxID=192944 RepID=UPI00339962B6
MTELTAADLPPRLTKPDGSHDIRGWITFLRPLPNELQNAEDATLHADFAARPRNRRRYATDTEKVLLRLLGFEIPDDTPGYSGPPLYCHIHFLGNVVRSRSFPSLKDQIPTTGVLIA